MSDLRSALEEAFANDDEKVEAAPQEASPIETPEYNRDEVGKFAAKETPAEPPALVEPEIKAPSSWKPEAKEAYIKAERGEALTPQEIKLLTAEANRRESDYHKGLEEYKTHAQKARQFEQVVNPYAQNFQQLGLDAPTAIQKLLEADHKLRHSNPQEKAHYLAQLANQYGVSLGQIQNPQQNDPQMQYLVNELQQLRQTQQMWQNSIQQQEQAKANHELEKFASDGKPHFEAVRNKMADFLERGEATTLEQAYEMAVWMRPDIRQTLIEQQQIEARKQYEEQQRSQRAKTASISVRGSSPTSSGSQPVAGSLRDILEAQFNQ
jgi:hypothetical protein